MTAKKNETAALSPEATALLAQLAQAQQTADALTPKPRSKGPRKIRTYFDTDAIIKAAGDLSADADWLDLLGALNIDDDSEDGPKIRTRLSQLINGGRLPENLRPIAPGSKPLYLAQKATDAIRAQLLAMGIDPDAQATAEPATAESAS